VNGMIDELIQNLDETTPVPFCLLHNFPNGFVSFV
jgi:hypothetical protein